MLKRWFHILFFVFAFFQIVSQIFRLPNLDFATKPMLLVLLASYYHQSVSSTDGRFILALLFCWLGDVSLLFDDANEIFFIIGLGSFLLAHLLLIFSYQKLMTGHDDFKGTQRVRLSFPIILIGSGLVVILYPHLGGLKIPVMIYACVLTLMVLQSVFRLGRTNSRSFWLVFFGAVFFMVSDALLAMNKFYQPISFSGVWVMTTYIAAVYLIVAGVIAHYKPAS